MYGVERDVARHELDLVDHEKRLSANERVTAVLAAKIGLYASLGAFFGGGLVAVVVKLVS